MTAQASPERVSGAALHRRAPAKINLTLHVTGQRPDGYHLLDSLVVRADVADTLELRPAVDLTLRVEGPLSAGVPADARNLVLKAAHLLDAGAGRGAEIVLTKHLPAAAGIGGGSADAAAALLALAELWQVPLPDGVERLGADVPVCLHTGPQRMQGVGERLSAVPALPDCAVVLVNPGVSVPTPQIFAALRSKENAPMPEALPEWSDAAALADWLGGQRNDLEPAALSVAPQIGECLAALDDALLARMSGSGATCFGLYATRPQAEAAADRIAAAQPDWWVRAGILLS